MNGLTIYLANNLGFYPMFKEVLCTIAERLDAIGCHVIEPFADCENKCVEREIPMRNMLSIMRSDVLVAIVDGSGNQVDDGIAWEMGYATALGKRIVVLRTRNIEAAPLNLQLHGDGITIVTSIEELIADIQ